MRIFDARENKPGEWIVGQNLFGVLGVCSARTVKGDRDKLMIWIEERGVPGLIIPQPSDSDRWEVVTRVFEKGNRCGDCSLFKCGGGISEEPWAECELLEHGGEPTECPGFSEPEQEEP